MTIPQDSWCLAGRGALDAIGLEAMKACLAGHRVAAAVDVHARTFRTMVHVLSAQGAVEILIETRPLWDGHGELITFCGLSSEWELITGEVPYPEREPEPVH